jgi:hypothetical protein
MFMLLVLMRIPRDSLVIVIGMLTIFSHDMGVCMSGG